MTLISPRNGLAVPSPGERLHQIVIHFFKTLNQLIEPRKLTLFLSFLELAALLVKSLPVLQLLFLLL